MPYTLIPKDELFNRVNNLKEVLRGKNIDGALLTQNVDIYYYSGTMQNSMLYVPNEGEAILFVKKSVERAREETPFIIEDMPSLKVLPNILKERGFAIGKIGTELDVLPYNQYQRIQNSFRESSIVDISNEIRLQRSKKSEYEIDLLRKSAEVLKDTIQAIPNIIRVGMTELELSSELEKFVRDRGHIGYIRTRAYNMELVLGMVSSGLAAASPTHFDGPAGGLGISPAMPQSASWNKIKEDEPIIIDIATAVEGYIIDQTRMAVIGELDQQLEEAYKLSLQIIKETEKNAKPGTLWSEHHQHALNLVEEAGLQDYFMGYKKNQARFLGHGVGLELDEFPVLAVGLNQTLEEGMVIAIEPKFTFPDKGVVGIESTYVVTKDGLELLSIAPEDIIRLNK